jgi:hypothetical protein
VRRRMLDECADDVRTKRKLHVSPARRYPNFGFYPQFKLALLKRRTLVVEVSPQWSEI